MIAKKNPKADLEKKRFAFFQIGLIIAGSLCLAAFEYTTVTAEESYVMTEPDYGTTVLDPDLLEEPMEPQKQQKKTIVVITDDVDVVDKKPDDSDVFVPDDKKDKSIIIDPGDMGGDEPGFTFVEPVDPIVPVPDREPEFPGGLEAMAHFINDEIQLPNFIPDYDQGTVYVQFVVNKNGSIEQVEIRQGLSKELNRAAKNVVKKMPNWVPGEQAGKPVRVRFTLPINITLN